jgi:hypothetical protein
MSRGTITFVCLAMMVCVLAAFASAHPVHQKQTTTHNGAHISNSNMIISNSQANGLVTDDNNNNNNNNNSNQDNQDNDKDNDNDNDNDQDNDHDNDNEQDNDQDNDQEQKPPKPVRPHHGRRLNLAGLCAMVHNNQQCTGGWTDRGIAGIILKKAHYHMNMGLGGNFNRGWRWSHPRVCCNNRGGRGRLQTSMYFLAKHCPAGTAPSGHVGTIIRNDHYKNNPFHRGGKFNSGWTWAHPFACRVRSTAHAFIHLRPRKLRRQNKPICLYGSSCPAGWVDKGFGGIIVRNSDYSKARAQGFAHGGKFNHGWRWSHPRICCTQ